MHFLWNLFNDLQSVITCIKKKISESDISRGCSRFFHLLFIYLVRKQWRSEWIYLANIFNMKVMDWLQSKLIILIDFTVWNEWRMYISTACYLTMCWQEIHDELDDMPITRWSQVLAFWSFVLPYLSVFVLLRNHNFFLLSFQCFKMQFLNNFIVELGLQRKKEIKLLWCEHKIKKWMVFIEY